MGAKISNVGNVLKIFLNRDLSLSVEAAEAGEIWRGGKCINNLIGCEEIDKLWTNYMSDIYSRLDIYK